jgi:PD-(D/E)XK endonuclease
MLLLGFGERAKSAGAVRIVRRRAAELGLDWSHFRGKRRWSDAELKQAVTDSRSWPDLMSQLGLSADGGKLKPHIQSHAVRLGLDTSHLDRLGHNGRPPAEPTSRVSELEPQLKFWRVAAGTLAATWFMIRGCAVSFPAEPTVYDLLADTPQGLMRVQVKSTTRTDKGNGWIVGIGHHPDTHAKKQGYVLAYSPDEIDLFFIVDGDMTLYLIPSRAVAGRVTILLRTYKKYIVGNARGLLGAVDEAGGADVPVPA